MGGTLTGFGIMNMSTDFNWHLDPEAAYVFLKHLDNIIVMAMESCWPGRMTVEECKKYRGSQTEVGKFFREISTQILRDKNEDNGKQSIKLLQKKYYDTIGVKVLYCREMNNLYITLKFY